jgi:putative effector of murein hydrolase LrgA (UPF0299 family)
MIPAIALLLLCQLAGEALARGTGLPVPGPVLGLVFLFLMLFYGPRSLLGGGDPDTSGLGRTADGLLRALALLFVPAGAGVVQHLGLLGEHGLALLAALVGSTLITLVATVSVFQAVRRWLGQDSTP